MKLSRRVWLLAPLVAALAGWAGLRPEAQAQQQPGLREEFRKLVIGERRPGDLNPQQISRNNVGQTIVERVRFTPEPGHDAVALIYRPKDGGPFPTVVAQHFLGGSKDHLLFAALLNGLAQRGLMAVAIDGRYRGERQNGTSLQAAMVQSLKTGKGRPWLIDTAYDVTRLLDYLETRPDVDAKRMGMTGVSEGGIITWMVTAADDRVKVAAPIIGVTSFGESFTSEDTPENREKLKRFDELIPALREYAREIGEPEVNGKVLRAAWEKLVPGSLDKFDGPSLLPHIAPRPLLIQNHEQDELFPIAGARKAYEAARVRYTELKVDDRLEFRTAPGKHAEVPALLAEVSRMQQWMERWLKAPA
jgi:predicted alpha/beta-hydrolase family hydrolase